MNATMAMLYDGLSAKFKCEKGGSYVPGTVISRTCCAVDEPVKTDNPNACFVCRNTGMTLPQGVDPRRCVLLAKEGDIVPDCAICVFADCDLQALRNGAARIVARYENWGDNLLQLTLHGAGLEELLDAAHGMFNNPMTIVDQNYHVHAFTAEDTMDDNLWEGSCPLPSGESVRSNQVITDFEEEGFVKYLDDLLKSGSLRDYETSIGRRMTSVIAKGSGNSVFGINVVHKNRALTDGDMDCLRFFADIASAKLKAIEMTWVDSSGSYYALLQDVIRGNLSDASEFKARLSRNWIRMKPNFTLMTIAARKGMLRYYQLCMIDDDLQKLLPEGKGVIHSRALTLFINHKGPIDKQIAMVKEYAEKMNLAVGVSESRGDDASLSELVEQTRFALRVRRRIWPELHMVKYVDCRHYYFIDLVASDPAWRQFLHPCLGELEAHDEENGGTFLTTLRCLVENYGNRTNTARVLGIQRNTLQYRIGRIEEICEIDLSDPVIFEHIDFSINLLDYCNGS